MGAFAPEHVHPAFKKVELTENQKSGFKTNDQTGSAVMALFDQLPKCRESSLAKNKLEEAIFWANKAILTDPDFGTVKPE